MSFIDHALEKFGSSQSVLLHKKKGRDTWTRHLQPCSKRLLCVDMTAQVLCFSRQTSKSASASIPFKNIVGVELCEVKLRTKAFARAKSIRPCLLLQTSSETFELLFDGEAKTGEWLEILSTAQAMGQVFAQQAFVESQSSEALSLDCCPGQNRSDSRGSSRESTACDSDSELCNSDMSTCDTSSLESQDRRRTDYARVAPDMGNPGEVRFGEGYLTPKFGA